MQISKDQLKTILDNAPAGADKVEVIDRLIQRGVTIEGVDMVEAQRFNEQYRATRQRPESTQTEQVDQNIGTGFDPTFESEEGEGFVRSAAKTVGNIPRSAFELGRNIFTAVTNPIETGKAVTDIVGGTAAQGASSFFENTEVGQILAKKIDESRVSRGLEPLERRDGKIILPDTEEMQTAATVGNYFSERYGSVDNFKESTVEDPVGVLSDIAGLVSGVGMAVKQTGNVSKVSRLSEAGGAISRVGDALEPTTAITRGVGTTGRGVANTLPGRITREAAPTAGRFADAQVIQALDLTQGDVARISQKTGNDVSDFVSRNNLLKETPEEIAMSLDSFKDTQYDLVRSEVAKVGNTYRKTDVPRVETALRTVKNTIDEIPGLEGSVTEVDRLLARDTYTLSDIQRVKEILDANTNIYTRSGEARGVATAEGLSNVRQELRSFIEDEVSRATDGATDIRQLNNDVATSRELMDAIELRETRGLTRGYSNVFNGILGASVWGATGDPLLGVGAIVAKKVAETPSFRIALARTLKATPIEDVNRWASEISNKNVSPQTRQAIANIVEEAKRNAEFIESGSQIIDETNSATTERQGTEEETTNQR